MWSRRIVGWSTADHLRSGLVIAALECELLARVPLADRRHAQRELLHYIEGWYNTHRRHSAIDELSPLEFETLHNNHLITQNTSLSTVRA